MRGSPTPLFWGNDAHFNHFTVRQNWQHWKATHFTLPSNLLPHLHPHSDLHHSQNLRLKTLSLSLHTYRNWETNPFKVRFVHLKPQLCLDSPLSKPPLFPLSDSQQEPKSHPWCVSCTFWCSQAQNAEMQVLPMETRPWNQLPENSHCPK